MHLFAAACIFTLLLAYALAEILPVDDGFVGGGQPLIADGTNTLPSNVPWHASLYLRVNNSYTLLCGGTLVAPRFVLTAAHCFDDLRDPEEWMVALGNYNSEWKGHETSTQRIAVERLVIHSEYQEDSNLAEHDIAFLEMSSPATGIGRSVRIARIDLDNRLPTTRGTVAGRGLTERNNISPVLQSITLPHITRSTCIRELSRGKSSRSVINSVTSDKFCAGYWQEGASVCVGDSGGGFITFDPDTNQPFVRGVVSGDFSPRGYNRTVDGCFSDQYTAFTNVTALRYIPWIKQEVPAVYESTKCAGVPGYHGNIYFCQLDGKPANCSRPMIVGSVAGTLCRADHNQLDLSWISRSLENEIWTLTKSLEDLEKLKLAQDKVIKEMLVVQQHDMTLKVTHVAQQLRESEHLRAQLEEQVRMLSQQLAQTSSRDEDYKMAAKEVASLQRVVVDMRNSHARDMEVVENNHGVERMVIKNGHAVEVEVMEKKRKELEKMVTSKEAEIDKLRDLLREACTKMQTDVETIRRDIEDSTQKKEQRLNVKIEELKAKIEEQENVKQKTLESFSVKLHKVLREKDVEIAKLRIQLKTQKADLMLAMSEERQAEFETIVSKLEDKYRHMVEYRDEVAMQHKERDMQRIRELEDMLCTSTQVPEKSKIED